MGRDRTLPAVRVNKKFIDELEWYGRHARVPNVSDRIRNLLTMGLQTWKIIVNEPDWKVAEIETQIDSLTLEQRERVFSKLLDSLGPERVKRLRTCYQETRQTDEASIEKERREREKQDRLADAKITLERFNVDSNIIQWVLGVSYTDREDEALLRLIHDDLTEGQLNLLPQAFKQYRTEQLAERRRIRVDGKV